MKDLFIVDSHTHILPKFVDDNRDQFIASDTTFKELFSNGEKIVSVQTLIDSMDKNSIDSSVVLGFGWTDKELAKRCNDYIINSYNKYSSRIIPFCSINPLWGDCAITQVSDYKKIGVRGIGELHPTLQNFELNDNFYQPFWDELKANNLPVVIHASEPVGHRYPGKGYLPADKLVDFINNNQNLKIICAHWGGGLIFYSLMPEINSILDNVFFDSAASNYLYDNRIFDIATRMMNSDKILFGSDFPIISQKAVLNSLNISITDELVKNKILGVNIGNLLKY